MISEDIIDLIHSLAEEGKVEEASVIYAEWVAHDKEEVLECLSSSVG
tara:strand:+ start:462 stop:602 length:141 start_codon:yes stop_codon:yes gene_type:complete